MVDAQDNLEFATEHYGDRRFFDTAWIAEFYSK